MAKKGEKKKEAKDAEPEFDFSKIGKELGNAEEEKHINQIAVSLTAAYIEHAKYDKDGVTFYKDEFTKQEAEQLADKLYDTLGYHLHRRYMKMDEKGYNELLKIKDANGNPYIDTITEHHFQLKRGDLKRRLARKESGNKLTLPAIQQTLEQHIGHHAEQARTGILTREHLQEPKHRKQLEGAIEGIVREYHEPSEDYELGGMSHQELLGTYLHLAQKHYRKGAHAEKKPKS